MKKLLTLVFLLIGLAGFTQTNSHLTWMGQILVGNRPIPTRSVTIEVLEYDTVLRRILPIPSSMYTVDNTIQAGMVYKVTFDETRYFGRNPFIVKATPNPGTTFYGYLPTYYPGSLSTNSARYFYCVPSTSPLRSIQLIKSTMFGPRFFTE